MKRWHKKYEWVAYAACGGDGRFTAEKINGNDVEDVKRICKSCLVRPECIKWALEEEASAVVVAGIHLPDPAFKRSLRRIYSRLRQSLPRELEARGEDI